MVSFILFVKKEGNYRAKKTLATTLRQTRKKKGLTQKQVAEKCGISDRSIRDAEHGTVNLKIDTVEKRQWNRRFLHLARGGQ